MRISTTTPPPPAAAAAMVMICNHKHALALDAKICEEFFFEHHVHGLMEKIWKESTAIGFRI